MILYSIINSMMAAYIVNLKMTFFQQKFSMATWQNQRNFNNTMLIQLAVLWQYCSTIVFSDDSMWYCTQDYCFFLDHSTWYYRDTHCSSRGTPNGGEWVPNAGGYHPWGSHSVLFSWLRCIFINRPHSIYTAFSCQCWLCVVWLVSSPM